jgi:hypothetical protein
MKKQSMLRLSLAILASVGAISAASAQTIAQTDGQHAQIQPAAVAQVADVQRAGTVAAPGATTGSTDAVAHAQNGRSDHGDSTEPCVGPVSFCTVFFGS